MRSQTGMAREEILKVFFDHFKEKYNASVGTITEADLEVARKRCETKFAREEWVHRIPLIAPFSWPAPVSFRRGRGGLSRLTAGGLRRAGARAPRG